MAVTGICFYKVKSCTTNYSDQVCDRVCFCEASDYNCEW